MAERVLTDDEMGAAYNAYGDGVFALGRAVEAAVIAKMEKRFKERFVAEMGLGEKCVTEREARKRERAAFEQGVHYGSSWGYTNYCINTPIQTQIRERERDRLYPLPTKRVPRVVVLSNGHGVSGREKWLHVNPFAYAVTADDARLLADLVENPWEEVPDDS